MTEDEKPTSLHCQFMAVIRETYPHGIDKFEAHEILMALARVAGDILGNDTSGAAVNGFFETVMLVRQTQPREIKFINRSLN